MKPVGKRGSVEDAVVLGIWLIIIAIMAFPIILVVNSVDDTVQANDELGFNSQSMSSDFRTRLPAIIEGIYLLLLIIGYFSAFILAFFIDSQPAFFVLAVIFFTAMVLIIPLGANVFDDMTNTPAFAEIRTQFTIIPFVMGHYLQITLVMWMLIGFGLYAKRVIL